MKQDDFKMKFNFAPGFFEEKPRREQTNKTTTSHERTPTSATEI